MALSPFNVLVSTESMPILADDAVKTYAKPY
jgi:hypothetical protein